MSDGKLDWHQENGCWAGKVLIFQLLTLMGRAFFRPGGCGNTGLGNLVAESVSQHVVQSTSRSSFEYLEKNQRLDSYNYKKKR